MLIILVSGCPDFKGLAKWEIFSSLEPLTMVSVLSVFIAVKDHLSTLNRKQTRYSLLKYIRPLLDQGKIATHVFID